MKKAIITLVVLAIILLAGDVGLYVLTYKTEKVRSSVNTTKGTGNVNQAISLLTNTPSPDDSDGDGLSNADEIKYGTDPNVFDTDLDGYTDGGEVATGHNPLAGAGFVFYNMSAQKPTPMPTENVNGVMTGVAELKEIEPIPYTAVSLEFYVYDKCVEAQDSGAQVGSKQLADGQTYKYCQLPAGQECNPQAFLFNQCTFRPAVISAAESGSINKTLTTYQAQFNCGGDVTNYSFAAERVYGVERQNNFYLVYALGEEQENQDAVYMLVLDSNFEVKSSYYSGEVPLVPEVKADGTLANPTGILYC